MIYTLNFDSIASIKAGFNSLNSIIPYEFVIHPLYNPNNFSIDETDIVTAYNESLIDINYLSFNEANSIIGDFGGVSGYAYFPDSYINPVVRGGNIYINKDFTNQGNIGSFFTHIFIHELGHALGLSHPHDGDALMPGVNENNKYTNGTYKSNSVFFTR